MASSSPNEDQSKTVVGQPVQFSYPPAYLPTTHNPYTAPPPAAYYQSDPHSSQPNKSIRCNKSILCGVVIFAFLLLAIITCTSNIAWLVLHPEPPLLQIDSLEISNFHVSQYKLTANWVANFTADNPNDKMRIVLYETDVYVFYKNYYLSWDGGWPDFNLDPKKQGKMSSHLEKIESEHLEMEKQLAQKIGEDRKSGMVVFTVRMDVFATYKAGEWWERRVYFQFDCSDLQVVFVGETGIGMFTGGRRCTNMEH